ncbi:hypothetical protein LDENG_00227990, partial [Lucifuga dentata]
LNQGRHFGFGSVSHRKTFNQSNIYQQKSCDNTLFAHWSGGRRKKFQTGSSFYGVKVNQSNKDECGSFPSHSII